ncbi:MAG: class I SAM-dependent methyltransferase [Betaproteobacteria bacterium]|nr:class I SAM-dependent methyltransferase [Betaproteobacteria bacterium]
MSIPGLENWLNSPQGRYALNWEQSRVDRLVADIFGFHAIQLGLPQVDFLRENRIPLRCCAGDSGPVAVRCDLRQLPFANASLDLVILPHVLEFFPDPHQILREVERVLIPEGQVVIVGFNPISLWGAYRRLACEEDTFPWNGRYLSALRLKDWLSLLGFEVDRGNFGCYAPPFAQEKWLRRSRFMEPAGDRWWGFAGGVYLLRAVKRVPGMRLLLPAWRDRMARAKALAPIAQKEAKNDGQ